MRPALLSVLLATLAVPAWAQDATPARWIAEALEQARDSGAIERLLGERYYLTRSEWLELDGGRIQRASEALVLTRGEDSRDGYRFQVEVYRPDSLEPTRFRCAITAQGLGPWGGEVDGIFQERRPLPGGWPSPFLPPQVAEWILPVLWDQGLPAELIYSESRHLALRSEAQAVVRFSPLRPGSDRVRVVIMDASRERTFEVGVGGSEDGLLLSGRARELYAGRRTGVRQEEVRQPLSAEEFAQVLSAWRDAYLEARLELRVRDSRSGEPIKGVRVTLLSLETPYSEEGLTDDEGRVHLLSPEAWGEYQVKCDRDYYHSFSLKGATGLLPRWVALHDGRKSRSGGEALSLQLDEATLRAGVSLSLQPSLGFAGQVVTEQGKPVVGASVRFDLVGEDGEGDWRDLRQQTRTESNGQFRLQTGPGTLRLVIDHPRWLAVRQEVTVTGGAPSLSVVLREGVELQGRVVDADGNALQGAKVEALPLGELLEPPGYDLTYGGSRVSDTTDELGRYLLQGVPEGQLVLRASREGYRPLTVSDPVPAARRKLQLHAGGGVSGRFVTAEGVGVTVNGAVTYRADGASWSVSLALADQEAFLVEDPTIGVYHLQIEAEGFEPVALGPIPAGTADLVVELVPR